MIQKANSDNPESLFYVEQLAEARASQAVPVLEKKYKRTGDMYVKAHIASALIRLGDSDPHYWDDLASVASKAVKSTAPSYYRFDSNGKALAGPSSEFIAWAKSKNIPLSTAGGDAFRRPGVLMLLAKTGDPRAVPILQEGLLSPNYLMETEAALGLAQLQDTSSIPMIISACAHAPAEAASAIAESLVYFDDPDAQRAVDEYLSPAAAKAYRDAKKHSPLPFSR
jgi:HEAT repeat protein